MEILMSYIDKHDEDIIYIYGTKVFSMVVGQWGKTLNKDSVVYSLKTCSLSSQLTSV